MPDTTTESGIFGKIHLLFIDFLRPVDYNSMDRSKAKEHCHGSA